MKNNTLCLAFLCLILSIPTYAVTRATRISQLETQIQHVSNQSRQLQKEVRLLKDEVAILRHHRRPHHRHVVHYETHHVPVHVYKVASDHTIHTHIATVEHYKTGHGSLPSLHTNKGGFVITTPDGRYSFAVHGLVVLNHSWFNGAYNRDSLGRTSPGQETQLHAARLGVSGNATKNWVYEVQIAKTGDQLAFDADRIYLRLANIGYTGFSFAHIVLGKQTNFFGIDTMHDSDNTYGTSFAMISQAFSPPVATGIGANGTIRHTFNWGIGVFHTGTVSREGDEILAHPYQNETGMVVGRLGIIFHFVPDSGQLFYAAVSGAYFTDGNNVASPININGSVAGTLEGAGKLAPVTSGVIFAPNGRGGKSAVLDAGIIAQHGPLGLEAEYAQLKLHLDNRAPMVHNPLYQGFLIQGGWVLTGEHRVFNSSLGYLTGVVDPYHWWGALELIARYGNIDLESYAGKNGCAIGSHAQTITAGLNWYINKYIFAAFDYTHLHVKGPDINSRHDGNGVVGEIGYFF